MSLVYELNQPNADKNSNLVTLLRGFQNFIMTESLSSLVLQIWKVLLVNYLLARFSCHETPNRSPTQVNFLLKP